MASTRLGLKLGQNRRKQAFESMHQAFYCLKYDISMTERPRLRSASENKETITPEKKETILLFSFYFLSISDIFCHSDAVQMAVCKRMDVSHWENSVSVTDN